MLVWAPLGCKDGQLKGNSTPDSRVSEDAPAADRGPAEAGERDATPSDQAARDVPADMGQQDSPAADHGPTADHPSAPDLEPSPDQAVPDAFVPDAAPPDQQASDLTPPDAPLTPDQKTLADCTGTVAGCTTWVDGTTDASKRKVTYSIAAFAYTPKCLRIRKNQTITFEGINLWPVTQVCGPAQSFTGGFGNSRTYSFTAVGLYGYRWSGNVAQGAIKVDF
jgi:hypothetical protein